MPKALLVSTDLIFTSRIRSAATNAGWEMQIAKSIGDSIDDDTEFVIVDLSTSKDEPSNIAETARRDSPGVKLIAFGPHVQTGKLTAAEEAGFDSVMTRGQFDRDLGQLFH